MKAEEDDVSRFDICYKNITSFYFTSALHIDGKYYKI